MTRTKSIQVGLLVSAALAASGCGIFKKSTPSTPVLGQRIDVLSSENDIQVDPATAAIADGSSRSDREHRLGAIGRRSDQVDGPGGARQDPRLALSSVQGGRGSTLTQRLAAAPIVAGGRVYVIDTLGTVRAFDAQTGARVWESQTPVDKGNEAAMYGGGIAFDNGMIYATNGLGYVSALDARNGGISWKVRPGGTLRGAPTVANGAVYVVSQDNQLYSLKESTARRTGRKRPRLEVAGVFGSASPAVGQGTVVAGFSSGELNAYRYENGRQVWGDTLQRTSISTSVSSISDIDADPVIDRGQVFAIGQGGRMVALDITSGQRMWELNIAGIATPWVAGDWVWVVTSDARLLCIARSNGHLRWIQKLPRYRKAKSKKGEIDYSGPVLAGGRLVLTGSDGAIISVDPATGAFQSQTRAAAGISLPPVVANSTLYILDDRGQLTAFR